MYMYICIKVYIFFYVAKNAVVFLLDKKLLFLHLCHTSLTTTAVKLISVMAA